ncbi:MAG: pyridoxamine 5'-phosphate oxidase family protein [Sneathiellaceae bacterium]
MTDSHRISDPAALREIYGEPMKLALEKVVTRIDEMCRTMIERAPLVVISTADAAGRQDVSPKGDAPGFVAILDENTLAIPDRKGNNRLDGLENLLANPNIALLFMIPGYRETLRVNGRARISADPALCARFAVQGKAPVTVTLVDVDEAFIHCGKALIRSKLWAPESQVTKEDMPSAGQLFKMKDRRMDAAEVNERLETNYREELY